jgi:hypothetical protein
MASTSRTLEWSNTTKVAKDKLVNGLDADFTNLSWGLFILMYVGLHKHKAVFHTLFYVLIIYQNILKFVSLKKIISITKKIIFIKHL